MDYWPELFEIASSTFQPHSTAACASAMGRCRRKIQIGCASDLGMRVLAEPC